MIAKRCAKAAIDSVISGVDMIKSSELDELVRFAGSTLLLNYAPDSKLILGSSLDLIIATTGLLVKISSKIVSFFWWFVVRYSVTELSQFSGGWFWSSLVVRSLWMV